jgi:mycothiol synthase
MVEIESWLDLSLFDAAAHAHRAERLREQGIAVRSLPELADDSGRDRKLYNVRNVGLADAPAVIPFSGEGYEDWRRRFFANPALIAEACWVAVAGGEYVGFTQLYDSDGGPALWTGLTGVVREHRGRGIASGLKAHALAWAKRAGRECVMTWNERDNAAIRAVNARLGFEPQATWIHLVKELGGDAGNEEG